VAVDPVRAKRARIAKLVEVGQRVGYGLFAIAIVAFVIGFIIEFNSGVVALIVFCLIAGSIILAPAIVFGYAVKAAEREDTERGL
jgi:peptidoglycan/LPS O-acetylase OafA/YrhL